jgi:hypothetical protein
MDPPPANPARLTRPNVGFMPNTPHSAAGVRIDPPPSAPAAMGAIPSATPTADPVDDPPAARKGLWGLWGIIEL